MEDYVLVSRTWLIGRIDDTYWRERFFNLFLPGLLTEFSQGHCWWIPRRQLTWKTKRFSTCYFCKIVLIEFDAIAWKQRTFCICLFWRGHVKFAGVVFTTLIPNVSREVCTCCFRDFDTERITWSLHVSFSWCRSQTCHVKFARVVFETLISNVSREVCTCCFLDVDPKRATWTLQKLFSRL